MTEADEIAETLCAQMPACLSLGSIDAAREAVKIAAPDWQERFSPTMLDEIAHAVYRAKAAR